MAKLYTGTGGLLHGLLTDDDITRQSAHNFINATVPLSNAWHIGSLIKTIYPKEGEGKEFP
jgi:hypothetical protein